MFVPFLMLAAAGVAAGLRLERLGLARPVVLLDS
jgi:hypothetical protein